MRKNNVKNVKNEVLDNDKKIINHQYNFFDNISKNELIWRCIWCVIFSVGFGILSYVIVKLFIDEGIAGASEMGAFVCIETVLLVVFVFGLTVVLKYLKIMMGVIDEDDEIIANVVGGTMINCYDDLFTIKRATPMFYTLLKYKKGEVAKRYHSEFSRLLVGEESRAEFARLKRQLREKGIGEAQYKLLCGDGSHIWISAKSRLTKNEKLETVVYTVLFDVSREKALQERLMLADARNKIVLTNINSGLFEWDIPNGTLHLSDQLISRFVPDGREVVDVSEVANVVETIDRNRLKTETDKIRNGSESKIEVTIQLKENSGKTVYSSINLTAVYDSNNVPVRAVGIVLDVEGHVKKELELRRKADHDPLTGVYNKGATQALIENALDVRCDDEHALIMIDVDDFKTVNDTFGHGIGDEAIKTVANLLKNVFGNDGVVGRIGGDEFMVLCRSINGDYEYVRKGLERLKTDDPHITSGDKVRKLTLSVGVALYPSDAATYTDLYKNADLALYKAKKHGKNGYVIYGGDFPNVEVSEEKSLA